MQCLKCTKIFEPQAKTKLTEGIKLLCEACTVARYLRRRTTALAKACKELLLVFELGLMQKHPDKVEQYKSLLDEAEKTKNWKPLNAFVNATEHVDDSDFHYGLMSIVDEIDRLFTEITEGGESYLRARDVIPY